MTASTRTADELIHASYSQTEVANGDWTEGIHAAFLALADDHVDCGDYVDYWGTTEVGGDFPRDAEWRVYLHRR